MTFNTLDNDRRVSKQAHSEHLNTNEKISVPVDFHQRVLLPSNYEYNYLSYYSKQQPTTTTASILH
jgi:hypothetical protein